MPQLWTETFVTQYFWLVAILLGFYFIASTKIIPQIANTLKIRRELFFNTIKEQKNTTVSSDNKINSLNLLSSILVIPTTSFLTPLTSISPIGEKDISNVKSEWVKKYSA